MDRSNVRYVLIFRPAYGLIVNSQMMGRAGRDGKESHVFFVTDAERVTSFRGEKTGREQCIEELDDVVHGEECRRYSTTLCMDGEILAVRCTQEPSCIPCDVCSPDSPMQRFAMEAIQTPFTPVLPLMDAAANNAVQTLPSMPAPAPAQAQAQASSSALIPDVPMGLTMSHTTSLPSLHHASQEASTFQDSDEMYDLDSSRITRSQALVLDAMEAIHRPRTSEMESDNPFMSASQPVASTFSRPELPPPSSLPNNPRTFASRAGHNNDALMSRLARTSRLNKYMPVLKNHCPIHFRRLAQLVSQDGHNCTEAKAVQMDEYMIFKKSFKFDLYTYCFHCCLPQSKGFTGEEPACHAGFSYKKGQTCEFVGFIFKAVFSMWTEDKFRKLLIKQPICRGATLSTLDEFRAWAVQEHDSQGKYVNCLEAFLWFCGEIEKAKPRFFM
ncbi:hypothetical protein BD769DRAFT_1668503 [Suillus cothurnatus]|nr:hypothetical protein BD769DRAFT_1668503 [Suillus cothurnatus]